MNTDNELIAEFMGVEWKRDHTNRLCWHYDELHLTSSRLSFDTSWNWLHPVVDKIESVLPLKVSITTEYVKIKPLGPYNQEIFTNCSHEGSKIKACYKAVVEFIKWYNTTKQEQTEKL